ncbi:hypothetical protein ACWPKS_15985 [Coraliomargarita sp. W4R72]
MSTQNPTQTTTIGGQPATLTASNRNLLRFQAIGGRISQMFYDIDHTYLHSIRLVHSLADDATRQRYPAPEDLGDAIPPRGPVFDEVFAATFTVADAAGWLPTADELRANIAKVKAELGQS